MKKQIEKRNSYCQILVQKYVENVTGEASKGYKKKLFDTERSKTMDKYSLMKMFHYGHLLQVYMYAFMYFNPDTILVEEYFPATKPLV